jgi:hypothetical protein
MSAPTMDRMDSARRSRAASSAPLPARPASRHRQDHRGRRASANQRNGLLEARRVHRPAKNHSSCPSGGAAGSARRGWQLVQVPPHHEPQLNSNYGIRWSTRSPRP